MWLLPCIDDAAATPLGRRGVCRGRSCVQALRAIHVLSGKPLWITLSTAALALLSVIVTCKPPPTRAEQQASRGTCDDAAAGANGGSPVPNGAAEAASGSNGASAPGTPVPPSAGSNAAASPAARSGSSRRDGAEDAPATPAAPEAHPVIPEEVEDVAAHAEGDEGAATAAAREVEGGGGSAVPWLLEAGWEGRAAPGFGAGPSHSSVPPQPGSPAGSAASAMTESSRAGVRSFVVKLDNVE